MSAGRAATLVDAAIIGTGQAGPALAVALAGRGESVAIFEGGLPGGSCVNVGCTPTKALRKSARVAHLARRAQDFGVQVGTVEVDFAAVMERTADIVRASRSGLVDWLEGTEGVTLVRDWARLDGREEDRMAVQSGAHRVLASRVYLNTGTRPSAPPIPGLDDVPFLTNETIMSLRERPAHLAIIGGGYVGLELGQAFRRLGSEVTILEAEETVASGEDPEIASRVSSVLASEGVSIRTRSRVTAVRTPRNGADQLTLDVESASGTETLNASHLLVATGRRPNTDRIGLETVGVRLDDRGFVTVDGELATSTRDIWALGDMNGRGAFTHTSYQDHEIVLANHTGGSRTADGRVMTYAMFTDPPLGRVGMDERAARRAMRDGRSFLSATIEMTKVSRAKEEGETHGVLRVLVDADTQRFAGASLLGIRCDEVVQVIGAMIAADVPFTVLRDALPVHPTVTEFFPTLLGRLEPLA